jgi:hypothetical protein
VNSDRLQIALLLFFAAVTMGNAAPVPDMASVHGSVTSSVSGEGLRKAYLRLAPVAGKAAGYGAVTNDQGSFEMEKIEPGSYHLFADCVGFLDAQYGEVELRLSAGDNLTGIEIRMTPQAVLSGRVLDQDGDPWPHANMVLYRSEWQKGRRHLELASTQEVDDRGEFRIASLPPGRYYFLAEPDVTWEKEHHPETGDQPAIRQQPTWYPSSSDVESAAPITLAPGQQFNGLDIRLRRGTGSTLRIRGKLTGLQDIPLLPANQRRFGPAISARRVSAMVEEGRSGTVQPDGSFEITGVAPGAYDIWITQGFPVRTALGRATVRVEDRDIENLSIDLHQPQTPHGSIRVEGDAGAKPPSVTLEPVGIDGFDLHADQKDDGSFEFDDLGFGRYRVYVQDPAPKHGYLKLLRLGNVESSDGSFTLSSNGVPLELVFSTHGAKLSGTVTGKAEMPKVILIPDTTDAARREFATRAAVFDQNGVFTIGAIAPGSYKLYAFENVPDDIWLDPEFLKEVESSGVPFEAAEGDAKTIQAPLLGKAETDRVLAKLGIE